MTSLYLCNRRVTAVVGRGGRRGVKVSAVYQAELPEGCLINGVVTGETALVEAMKEFISTNALPTDKVGLVLNSTQFVHRVLTLPTLPEKKLRTLITREMSGSGDMALPLDDYMVMSTDKKTRTTTLLATRVDKSALDPMMTLAEQLGLKIQCIDFALACLMKLVALLPELENSTFIVHVLDGENLYSTLFEQGVYKYSTRSRMFNTRGTAEFGTELAQKTSGIVQFHTTSKDAAPITDVYFSGVDETELLMYAPGCEALQLRAGMFPDAPGRVTLPEGCRLAQCLYTTGNLIAR